MSRIVKKLPHELRCEVYRHLLKVFLNDRRQHYKLPALLTNTSPSFTYFLVHYILPKTPTPSYAEAQRFLHQTINLACNLGYLIATEINNGEEGFSGLAVTFNRTPHHSQIWSPRCSIFSLRNLFTQFAHGVQTVSIPLPVRLTIILQIPLKCADPEMATIWQPLRLFLMDLLDVYIVIYTFDGGPLCLKKYID